MSDVDPHSLAELFPLIEGDAFDSLVADIRENGLREPITLFEGKILDGRNRYFAMLEIDREFGPDTAPKMFVQFNGDDALEWVVSKNLHRRHLKASQRALIAAEIANLPSISNGSSPGVSVHKASKIMNVSERTIHRARKLIRRDPKIASAIRAGTKQVGEESNQKTLTVVLTDKEHKRCTVAAEKTRLPVATWMRVILLKFVDGEHPIDFDFAPSVDEARERDRELCEARKGGTKVSELSASYGLSISRVYRILKEHPSTQDHP